MRVGDFAGGTPFVGVRPVVDDEDEHVGVDRPCFALHGHQIALQKPRRGVVDDDDGKPSVLD